MELSPHWVCKYPLARLEKIGKIDRIFILSTNKTYHAQNVHPELEALTEGEALAAAQAVAYYCAIKQAGDDAPQGKFLNKAEIVALNKGRDFMQKTLERRRRCLSV